MIISRKNDSIKNLNKIINQRNGKKETLFAIEGFTIFDEAIKENINIKEIYISDNEEIYFKQKYDYNYILVKDDVLKSVSKTESGKGIIFTLEKKKEFQIPKSNNLLYIDGVSDPGNMGAIIRSADAFGINEILISNDSVNIYNEKVLRSTMGSIFRVNFKTINYKDLEKYKELGYKIIASSPRGNDKIHFDKKNIMVIGNEANGVRPEVFDISDEILSIKMKGRAESLNVSVAAGILMYMMEV